MMGQVLVKEKDCDMCTTRENDGYCSQCELYICQICFDNHLKIKSCRDHVLVQDSHESNTHESAIRFETCDEHKQQEVKAYCTEHKCCVCIECILLHHKSCEWEYIIDASNRFQNSGELARLLEKIQSLEYTLDIGMEAIDKHTKSAETINKDVISNIESFTKSLVEYVAGSKQQVLDDAKVRETAHQHKLDKMKVDIQSLGSQLEEIITDFRDEDMLHKRFILAVETMPKVARIQDELVAIDCNNIANDYTFRPRNFLKRMMSNTRPIGRLTDASHIEEDEEDEEDINLKKECERCLGLEQQLQEIQGYPTAASAPHSIVNGFKRLLALAVETDITFAEAERTKEYLADPSKFALAAPVAAAAASTAAAPAAKKEEKKEESEESDDDMDFGLFD